MLDLLQTHSRSDCRRSLTAVFHLRLDLLLLMRSNLTFDISFKKCSVISFYSDVKFVNKKKYHVRNRKTSTSLLLAVIFFACCFQLTTFTTSFRQLSDVSFCQLLDFSFELLFVSFKLCGSKCQLMDVSF